MNRICTVSDFIHSEPLAPVMVSVTPVGKQESSSENTRADIAYSSEGQLITWLNDAERCSDPFSLLTSRLQQVADKNWNGYFTLTPQTAVECRLAFDVWDSTAFGQEQPGEFKYIELFEHNRETTKTAGKALFILRFSSDSTEGEWLWINRGDTLPGSRVKELAEKISRSMKIVTCYLADSAKVDDIAIRIPLQIMRGYGYYGPLFSLAEKYNCKSNVAIFGSDEQLQYNQNPQQHQFDLAWLQAVKVNQLFTFVFKGCPAVQSKLSSVAKKHLTGLRYMKDCDATLQDFMRMLYADTRRSCDYKWACHTLLNQYLIPEETDLQKQYKRTLIALDHNMLHVAHFYNV